MPYQLGDRSLKRLSTVDPVLAQVVTRAIQITPLDFGVVEGLRDLERQKALVASGASQTLNSKHLPNAQGLSEAVDLAAYLDTDGDGTKEFSWREAHCLTVAEAMRKAAVELGVRIRWGGCWIVLNDTTLSLSDNVQLYMARCLNSGRKPFLDYPHFEILRTQ